MSRPAAAGTVTLEWDPVKGPLLAGYAIHYGPASGTYTTKLDVGNTTRHQVSNLVEGNTYYFVLTPYDTAYAESEPSNEVSTTVPSVASVASLGSGTTVWLDDAAPGGATLAGDGGDGWNWVATDPAPFSGSWAHQSALAAGEHGHYFWGAAQTLSVAVGDTLIAYVYLDPAYPPRELMLQWFDGTWHRAYWGVDLIPWGVDGTQSRYPMGPLPPAGQWVTLSVPASLVGLEGSTVTGMGFTLYDGRATWD